jgi:hypothetical protein
MQATKETKFNIGDTVKPITLYNSNIAIDILRIEPEITIVDCKVTQVSYLCEYPNGERKYIQENMLCTTEGADELVKGYL